MALRATLVAAALPLLLAGAPRHLRTDLPGGEGCVFDVARFGARGDNATDSSAAVRRAIAAATASTACRARTVRFSDEAADEARPTVFLSRPIALSGVTNLGLVVEAGVTLAPYLREGSIWDWPLDKPKACGICFTTFIDIADSTNVSLGGSGLIDGRGGLWWPQRWHNATFNKLRHPPYMLHMLNTSGFELHNLTLIDPPAQFFSMGHSSRVRMSHFNFSASWVNGSCPHPVQEAGHANSGLCEPQNSDGVDIAAGTHDVHIHDAFIQNGDDTITIKYGYDSPATRTGCVRDVLVEDMVYRFGWGSNVGGPPFGGCAENITFRRIAMSDMAGAGCVVKTENTTDPSSYVRDVLWEDITINGSRDNQKGCVGVSSLYQQSHFHGQYVVAISNLTWRRVHGTRCNLPGELWCPASQPCRGLVFDHVDTSDDAKFAFSCKCPKDGAVHGYRCGPTTSAYAHGIAVASDPQLGECLLKSDDDNPQMARRARGPIGQSCVDLPPEPPSVLDQPVSPPPMSDWTRSARILQPWGPTQFELVRNASRLAPLLGSAYGFNTVILLPAPAHLSYCAADGPCALTAADIAAGVDAFRAAGWRVILYTSFMHVGEAQAWTNGSVNRQHPDWAQRNGSGVAWQFEGSHSPLSPCSEDVLAFTQSYATTQAAALHQPDATMLDNNEMGPLAWGCSSSGCGYEPPCAVAFDKYVRARFNSSMLRSCFGDLSAGPVVPPPISARGSSLHGLWVHFRNRAMALVNRRFGDQLRSSGRRLLTNTAIDWADWSLAQDLQYAAEDVVLSEVYDSDPMLLHASLSLGVGLSQGRPYWAALYQNQMRAVEMAPGVVRRLLTFAAAHQVAPWLVFESVLLNSSDPRAAALQSTHRWLAGEAASFRGGKMVAPVACVASAATRNSIGHNASKHVAITPSRCLNAAAALGAPVRVVYDGDYRGTDEWLDGVSLLVLDGVRCLPQRIQRRILAWSQAGGHGRRI